MKEEDYVRNPKLCKYCQDSIPFLKRKYKTCGKEECVKSRYSSFRKNKDKLRSRYCLNCEKKLSRLRYYCNNQCHQDFCFRKRYSSWIEGSGDAIGIKRKVVHRDGYKCSDCEIFVWNGREIGLELEHRDGNSENNSPENVCLLCPNCHSQTPTYKGKNRGNGRFYRRQRWREGKSY